MYPAPHHVPLCSVPTRRRPCIALGSRDLRPRTQELKINSLSVAAYVAYVGVETFLASFRNDVELFCTTCGHEGEPARTPRSAPRVWTNNEDPPSISYVRRARGARVAILVASTANALEVPTRVFLLVPAASRVQRGASAPCPGASQVIRALNNGGEVVGGASLAGSSHRAFILSSTRFERIEGLPGADDSAAHGINDLGEVVGSSNSATSVEAFRWTRQGGLQRLAPLPGDNSSEAVRHQQPAAGRRLLERPRWHPGRSLDSERRHPEARHAPRQHAQPRARAQSSGDVIGAFGISPATRAFLWTPSAGTRMSACCRATGRAKRCTSTTLATSLAGRAARAAVAPCSGWGAAQSRISGRCLVDSTTARSPPMRTDRSSALPAPLRQPRLPLDTHRRDAGSQHPHSGLIRVRAHASRRHQRPGADRGNRPGRRPRQSQTLIRTVRCASVTCLVLCLAAPQGRCAG